VKIRIPIRRDRVAKGSNAGPQNASRREAARSGY
jgi:hypothetical protein